MSLGTALLLPLLVGPVAAADQDYDAALRALEDGAFGIAWELAGAVTSEVDRARARTAILSAAGDLPGALAAARAGLEDFPHQPELLWYATSCAIALRDGAGARQHVDALAAALASGVVEEAHRASWEGARRSFLPEVEALERSERERHGALRRARAVALAMLGLLGLLFLASATGRLGGAPRAGPSV